MICEELKLGDLRLKDVIDGKYEIIGGLIYVRGDVDLCVLNLTAIPWKFGRVSGDFYCHGNHLATLNGAPTSVGGSFDCAFNQLDTLEGAPKSVGRSFYCHNNRLKTLEGAPQSVGEHFYCRDNPLVSHAGKPAHIGGEFFAEFELANNCLQFRPWLV